MAESKRIDEISPILEIGLDLSMKVRDEAYDAAICGWKPEAFLLIDCPAVSSGSLKVVPDTAIRTRFVNKGFVVSCSTTIIGILKQPVNILVLEFPVRYEKMQVTKFPSMDVCLPALFNDMDASTPETKNVRHKATTLDLSLGGALIASKQQLKSSQRIALSIKLYGVDKVTNIMSTVKNTPKDKRFGNDTYHLAGVSYDGLNEEQKGILVKFIEGNRPFRS